MYCVCNVPYLTSQICRLEVIEAVQNKHLVLRERNSKPCIHIQAAVGVGTVLIWDLI